jgi:hypothetical protein
MTKWRTFYKTFLKENHKEKIFGGSQYRWNIISLWQSGEHFYKFLYKNVLWENQKGKYLVVLNINKIYFLYDKVENIL